MNWKIQFVPVGVSITVEEGTSVLEAARSIGLPLNTLCTGNGACGKCVVIIGEQTFVSNPTVTEKLTLTPGELAKGCRLACLTRVHGDVIIQVRGSSLRESSPSGLKPAGLLQLGNYPPRAEYQQLEQAFGIAVDIGTTTLAGYLHDLKNQNLLCSAAVPNPQVCYGGDILTRLQFGAASQENLAKLRNTLFHGLNRLFFALVQGTGIAIEDIQRLSVVGNTVMHHFFLGLDLRSLSLYPFQPELPKALIIPLNQLGGEVSLLLKPEALIDVLPVAGGFVGSDLVVGLLAIKAQHWEEPFLYLDLGTNNEVALGSRERILVSSTSAGPAFEGGSLTCGMRAVPGAIDEFKFTDQGIFVHTVQEKSPLGLCGSGAICLLGELLKEKIINERGRLLFPNGQMKEQPAYLLDLPGETKIGLTDKDIGELQKAKAAVFAAANILAAEFGTTLDRIEKVFIAGAFGTHLPIEQAVRIGLLPGSHADKIEMAGNAAGDGARLLLLSEAARPELKEILGRLEVFNIGEHPLFQSEFVKAMFLPHEKYEWFGSPER